MVVLLAARRVGRGAGGALPFPEIEDRRRSLGRGAHGRPAFQELRRGPHRSHRRGPERPQALKITRVEAVPLSIPSDYGADAMPLGSGGWKSLDFCLVRVDTDAGLTGWGEAFSYSCRRAVVAAVRDMIVPIAVGRDAMDITGLHAEIQKRLHIFGRFGITAFALSGLDIALWDLAGKAAGKPLHALLGGAKRRRLACYASLLRYADESLVARYCERALGE